MNHYCTYFDRGFAIQGLALWRSLARHDSDAILWILALDEPAAHWFEMLREPGLRVVRLADVERGDPELTAAKSNRSKVEYYFTLSPCWPRWLLAKQPEIDCLTYLDADLFFFASPAPIFAAMDAAGASILITAHRFPRWLRHYERHGRYNVGVQVFRNDHTGRQCLDDWRNQCLAWCYDRLEDDRYADQKYLDRWPDRFGAAVLVLPDRGVNLAPWNWGDASLRFRDGRPIVNGAPVIVFHFARFRPVRGGRWWQSGQLDYGVMPYRWRRALYSPYWRALESARRELQAIDRQIDFPRKSGRMNREYWRGLPLRLGFGGDWLRVGDRFFNLRLGVGRWSGRAWAALRGLVRRPM